MQVWVDADACPKIIKEMLFRAAQRTKILTILVSNRPVYIPPSPYIQAMIVSLGFDVADNHIIERIEEGDLVITADIPLADAVITKGAIALNPRGTLYSRDNVKRHLSIRNFNAEQRSAGMITGGPPTLSKREACAFANALDKFLRSG